MDDQGPRILISTWVLTGLSCAFLALRLFCKFKANRGLWWDDYILVASWVSSWPILWIPSTPSLCGSVLIEVLTACAFGDPGIGHHQRRVWVGETHARCSDTEPRWARSQGQCRRHLVHPGSGVEQNFICVHSFTAHEGPHEGPTLGHHHLDEHPDGPQWHLRLDPLHPSGQDLEPVHSGNMLGYKRLPYLWDVCSG